jgi:hypothetical protein
MISLRSFIFTALGIVAIRADASVVYYVDLTNAARVTSVEVSREGSERFQRVAMVRDAGPGALSIAIPKGRDGCRRDLRLHFDGGAAATFRAFDLCAADGAHVGGAFDAEGNLVDATADVTR